MHHVQWPLVALSFVIGLALTIALMVRRVEPQEPEPAATAKPDAEPGSAAAKKAGAVEPQTTKIPAAKGPPTTKIAVGTESGTAKFPVDEESPTTEIPAAKESPTRHIPAVRYASYGPGSARAAADGSGPAGWLIKGRTDTRLYYTPDDPVYDPTVAQVWFKDEESAARAFFTPWRKRKKVR